MRADRLLLGALCCVVLGGGAGAAYAAFAATTSNPASAVTAAPDWVAPTASASVIAKDGTCSPNTPGFVKQGQSFFVYANVTDTGNPASGTASVTSNVTTLATGQSGALLTSGSFALGGTTYGYRSSSIASNAPLTEGSKAYSLALADQAANSATQTGFSATVDNTAPTATDVQPTNKVGGTLGRAEVGDLVTYTMSEPLEPCSVLAGWDGNSTSVTVRIADVGTTGDTVTVWSADNTTQLALGSVDLRGDVVTANTVFSSSSMALSGNSLVITLGTLSSGTVRTDTKKTRAVWTPSTAAYDRAANTMSATATPETGAADVNF